jgi:hypothetical protein
VEGPPVAKTPRDLLLEPEAGVRLRLLQLPAQAGDERAREGEVRDQRATALLTASVAARSPPPRSPSRGDRHRPRTMTGFTQSEHAPLIAAGVAHWAGQPRRARPTPGARRYVRRKDDEARG